MECKQNSQEFSANVLTLNTVFDSIIACALNIWVLPHSGKYKTNRNTKNGFCVQYGILRYDSYANICSSIGISWRIKYCLPEINNCMWIVRLLIMSQFHSTIAADKHTVWWSGCNWMIYSLIVEFCRVQWLRLIRSD